jgi:hypothetical protein
MLQCNTRKTC